MKSLLRYPGGKSRKSIKEKIFNRFPLQYESYREPFCGGSGIYFNIPPNKKRWINDVNPDLMALYVALKDQPETFISQCRAIEPEKPGEELAPARNGKPLYSARLKKVFEELIEKRYANPALSYFFINRTVFGGRVNYDIPSRLYFSNPSGWNIVKTDVLERAAECLQDTKITVGGYESLLLEGGDNVIVFCDPPYYVQTNTTASSQLYQYCFKKEDHIKFKEIVQASKHKVCITYDDDEEGFIRNLFDSFNIYKEQWTYSGTCSAEGHSKTKKKGNELIITNY